MATRQAALAIVSVALLAGCGGGGGSSSSSSRLSKSELDSKADAICDKYQKKINHVKSPKSLKEIPGYIDEVLPILREGTSKLSDLKPPADLQSTFDEWRQIQRSQVDAAVALKKAAEKGDAAEVARIASEAETKNKRGNQLASQLGAKACAQD